MELEMERQNLRAWRCAYKAERVQEETVEAVVGAELPDVAELIETQAQLYMRSKESENGRIRVSYALEGTILYRSDEDGGLYAQTLRSEGRMDWEGEEILREAQLCVSLRLCSAQGRIVNPRKLSLRCELSGEAEAWVEETVEYSVGVGGDEVELKRDTVTLPYVAAVTEKAFVLTEDFSLGEGVSPIETLLCSRMETSVEGLQPLANKLMLQGKAKLELLYLGEGSDTAQSLSFPFSFSQLVDVSIENAQSTVKLMPTALYVDPGLGGSEVALELHLTAQVVCSSTTELSYLSDAYSIRCETELNRRELCFTFPNTETEECVLEESVPAPEKMERILQSYGVVGKKQVSGTPIRCSCLYADTEGSLCSLERELMAEQGSAEPLVRELSVELSGGELRYRLAYSTETGGGEELRINTVDGITLREDCQRERGSASRLYAVRREGRSLWELAKAYGSTVALIEACNEEKEENERFLFIPRAR